MFQVQRGFVQKAVKTIVYGPEGIGKSTLAAMFPNPIFIDTEGSTNHMDVNRLDPSSFTILMQQIDWIKSNKQYSTLIIDTMDWAEKLATEEVLAEHNVKSMESFDYQKGYTYLHERIGKLLDKLTDVINAGINVVLVSHAKITTFNDPTEMGAYDRWELKLRNQGKTNNSALVKEWADMILFVSYNVISVKADQNGKTFKGQGGQRVMYTEHRPAYDAKNRFGLPADLPMDYSHIAHVIPDLISSQQTMTFNPADIAQTTPPPVEQVAQAPGSDVTPAQLQEELSTPDLPQDPGLPSYLPPQLIDLMKANNVTVDELTGVMGLRGHYPIDTSFEVIAERQPEYFTGGLAANWDNVIGVIQSIRQDPSQLIDLFAKVGETNPTAKVASMNINRI